MDDKRLTRSPVLPNLGMAVGNGGRVNARDLVRRKLMRKMVARRMRNAEMVSGK